MRDSVEGTLARLTLRAQELRRLLRDAPFEVVRLERYRISPRWGLMTAVARKPAVR